MKTFLLWALALLLVVFFCAAPAQACNPYAQAIQVQAVVAAPQAVAVYPVQAVIAQPVIATTYYPVVQQVVVQKQVVQKVQVQKVVQQQQPRVFRQRTVIRR